MSIENHDGLLVEDGRALGYLFDFQGHGIYSPNGRVEITKEQMDTHNRILSEAEVKGLDENCQVGQWGTFYYIHGKVQTWMGALVTDAVRQSGKVVTFFRNGKTFRGRLQKDADCFNFKRIS